MAQEDILLSVAQKLSVDVLTAKHLEEVMIKLLKECNCALDAVAIPGFGTFSPFKTDECVQTGEDGKKYLIPPYIELQWRPSIMLRKQFVS